MIIGISILAIAALAGIAGTFVGVSHDGYHHIPTRTFDR